MPGAVVGVIRDGKVVLTKRYGMADIERGVPMSPSAEFFIGSMSKQFTAFAIHLLAHDGKLSLDDDVHLYLPDVPDFGRKITVRHLLHHTSGLRDYFDLMAMAGLRPGDVIDEDKALALIRRQRKLNFEPGQEWDYSNTGYVLLARIVEHVAGKPFPEFARERIFVPLGMTHTLFQQDYRTLVPGRVLSYVPADTGGYRYAPVNISMAGDGGVLTTMGDLALAAWTWSGRCRQPACSMTASRSSTHRGCLSMPTVACGWSNTAAWPAAMATSCGVFQTSIFR
jgi:CubicO group peptidase (beta-lactamase class C family)